MKLLREGSWRTESKSDPRFNLSGRGDVGGFVIPSEAKEALDKKAEELGVPIPEDTTFEYMKD